MDSQNKNPVIDADAHVVECAHTWDFMDKSEEKYRPIPLEAREEAGVRQQFWLVDGKVRGFRFAVLSDELMAKRQQQVGRKFAEQQESRELANVDLRLEHMDQTGVDIQVLHNTMFIESCTDRPAVDVALCKSWNRWLADIWKQSEGRLRRLPAPRGGQSSARRLLLLPHLRRSPEARHGDRHSHRQR